MRVKPSGRGRGPTRGFTVTEVTVSILVFGVVMSVALSFLRTQNQGFMRGLSHMATAQTLRSALGTLERHIQTAGTNLAEGQPEVVFAGGNVLAFNADYATRSQGDPFSVFFEPGMEERATRAFPKEEKVRIPGTSFPYPHRTYRDPSGRLGPAETLIFFFAKDARTEREDDFALYRQVNSDEPQLVADHILKVEGRPFFQYLTTGEQGVESIPPHFLPLAHKAAFHGSPADTGLASLVDSVRAVRITLAGWNGKEGHLERRTEVSRLIRMPNVGLEESSTCGGPPRLGTNLSARLLGPTDPGGLAGKPSVQLRWGRAEDEGAGEEDIVRYVIWRKEPGDWEWKEPFLSIPAGEESYVYADANLIGGRTYQYALAAQDCTPALSPLTESGAIKVPIR